MSESKREPGQRAYIVWTAGYSRPGFRASPCWEELDEHERRAWAEVERVCSSTPEPAAVDRAALDRLPEWFCAAIFVDAGLSLEDASTALMVSRRVLEDFERKLESERALVAASPDRYPVPAVIGGACNCSWRSATATTLTGQWPPPHEATCPLGAFVAASHPAEVAASPDRYPAAPEADEVAKLRAERYELQGAIGGLLSAIGSSPQADAKLEEARQAAIAALSGRKPPLKLLVSNEWLERKIAEDRDVDTDAGHLHYDAPASHPAEVAAPPGEQWVPVTERLPSTVQSQVLVVRQEKGASPWVGSAWYRGPKRPGERRRGDWECNPWGIVNDVTHWRPLPAPPKGTP